MATTTRKAGAVNRLGTDGATANGHALNGQAANGHAGHEPAAIEWNRIDDLLSELQDIENNDWQVRQERDKKLEAQARLVVDAERQLQLERRKFEAMVRPLMEARRMLSKGMMQESLRAAAGVVDWEVGLETVLGKLEVFRTDWWDENKTHKTGAVPWETLRERGATDAELLKNLERCPTNQFDDERLNVHGKAGEFWYRGRNQVRATKVIGTRLELLAAVRRILGIGLPAKTAAKPKKKPSGKSPAKGAKASGSKPRTARRKPAADESAANGSLNGKAKPSIVDLATGRAASAEPDAAIAERRAGGGGTVTGPTPRKRKRKP